MRVLVVGAGLGGLTVAAGLARRGHAVTVVERAPAPAPVGAGILLAPNAIAVLAALGLDPRPVGRRLSRMDIADDTGRTLQPMDLPPGPDGALWAFHRAELHAALDAALPPTVDLRWGASLTEVRDDTDGVQARVNDEEIAADLVIAADGLRSRVRTARHPDARVVHSGQTCWRCVVPARLTDGAVEAWGPDGARFGVVPLTEDRAYLFLVLPAEAGASAPDFPALQAVFGAFRGRPADVFSAVTPDALRHHDLEQLAAPVWGTPRVWLLGDAAHAMTPNLGQGAAMAIKDAGADGPLAARRGPPLVPRRRRPRRPTRPVGARTGDRPRSGVDRLIGTAALLRLDRSRRTCGRRRPALRCTPRSRPFLPPLTARSSPWTPSRSTRPRSKPKTPACRSGASSSTPT